MRIWTAQRNSTLEIILKNGIYFPDFSLAEGMGSEGMKAIYPDLLNKYCILNNVQAKGLIFAISSLNGKGNLNYSDYKNFFEIDSTFSSSVSFLGKDYSLLEIEVENTTETIPLNFKDFIIIAMRKIGADWRMYSKYKLYNMVFTSFANDLEIAQTIGFTNDENDNEIEQCHIHEINIKNIIGVYPIIDFENHINYELSKEANELLRMIKKR